MTVFDIAAAELQKEEITERLDRLNRDLSITSEAIKRAEMELYRLEGRIAVLLEQGAVLPEKKHKKRTNRAVPSARDTNPTRSSVADAALAVIAENGRPMTRAELYEELGKRGVRVAGKDPVMVFSTMLWRERKRVARLRGFGYWPADRPYAPAGYDPGNVQPSLL